MRRVWIIIPFFRTFLPRFFDGDEALVLGEERGAGSCDRENAGQRMVAGRVFMMVFGASVFLGLSVKGFGKFAAWVLEVWGFVVMLC